MTAIFDRAFDQLHSQAAALTPLSAQRADAILALRALGLPSKRSEAFRNFSLLYLKDISFSAAAALSAAAPSTTAEQQPLKTDNPSLVFVGGSLKPALSTALSAPGGDHGLDVTRLGDCDESQWARIQQLMTPPKESTYQHKDSARRFQALLSQSFVHDGVLLSAKDSSRPAVIDVVTIAAPGRTEEQTGLQALAGFPHLFAEVGEGCTLEIRQVFVDTVDDWLVTGTEPAAAAQTLSAPAFYGDVAAGGELRHYLIQRETGTHLGKSIVRVARKAKFDGFQLLHGKGRSRQEVDIVLAGPHSDIQLNGLYLAEQGSRIDSDTRIHHNAAHTDSRQLYKGVIWDGGMGSFSGQIIVARDSQQVDAHQLNNNLLMGDKAIAHTRPQLAIDADDVKCAHGATVGSLKPEELFYLTSRGIAKTKAQQMLTLAYCRDVIDQVASPAAKEWLLMELSHAKGL